LQKRRVRATDPRLVLRSVQGKHGARLATVLAGIVCLAGGCVDRHLRADFTRGDHGLLASPALHLVLCGTGGVIADRSRAGPCTAIVAAGHVFLVDLGPGAWEGADLAGLPLDALRAVLFTTFLAENIADFGEALTRSWIAGRTQRLVVYGPPGTARVVNDVTDAYRLDVTMRVAHHDAAVLHPELAGADAYEFALAEPDGSVVVLDDGGLRITAFSVGAVGTVPSVGYRFDYAGRSIVIAGHAHHHPNVVRFAAGADVLVHEAANPEMIHRGIGVMDEVGQTRLASFSREMLRNYASPIEVAEIARDAGVGLLVFTRLYPPPTSLFTRWVFLRGVRSVFRDVVLGEDGMRFRLDPAGGRRRERD
jgi:ribonuclease Z